ncbi:hypothetical protein SUDANB15_02723 [Streptomyces sp. enrichment culture]|uniref:tyrosinase family oxidase copper chaperone n=1 Tax=Streptomyces sp. enrichment culture TaxID=1795815 RepID=UPI003F56CA84
MVISIGGAPVGAEDEAPGPARPGPAGPGPEGRTRREVTRGLRACALTAALAPLLTAFRAPHPRSGRGGGVPDGTAADRTSAEWATSDRVPFDRTYRGCRIQGVWIPARGAGEAGRWHVTVDGRPLHLMRRADGSWLSTVDHYCSYPTPLEAARAAVDALPPGQRLRAPDPADDAAHPHEGGRHGVRA